MYLLKTLKLILCLSLLFPQNSTYYLGEDLTTKSTQLDASSIQSQSFKYFGKHAIVLYRLNPDYAALYVNNSSTSQNISTLLSTFNNGLGNFSGVNTDTLFIDVKKLL